MNVESLTELNRESKAAIRTAETPQLTEKRRKLNRECSATTRTAETVNRKAYRKTDRDSKAVIRAQKLVTKEKSVEILLMFENLSKSLLSLESAIDSFIAKTKQGPDYVCVSCHRLMYRQTVLPLK